MGCTAKCVAALKDCIAGGQDYADCMGVYSTAKRVSACPQGCTPTWEMLTQSQVPYLHTTNENGFGAPTKSVCKDAKPSTSICTYPASKVSDCPPSISIVV